MKFISIIIFGLVSYSCDVTLNQTGKSSSPVDYKIIDSPNVYMIKRVDTAGNLNIIWAQKKELLYKIVSFKDTLRCNNTIKVGNYYTLTLTTVFPPGYHQKRRVSVVKYGSDEVELGGSKEVVWDLFSCENLKGLCLNN